MFSNEPWDACPSGTIREMVDGRRRQRRRRLLGRFWAVSAVCLLLAAGIAGIFQLRDSSGRSERISCAQAVELFVEHFERKLSPQDRRRVDDHLDHCPHCRELYDQQILRGAAAPPRAADLAFTSPF